MRWNTTRILCDFGDVVTAGGFLAAIDLALALVEKTCGRAVSRGVGRHLLADSTRQHQSIYATSLVPLRSADPRLQRLERWIEQHLSTPLSVEDMAEACHLSPRISARAGSFSRGVPPAHQYADFGRSWEYKERNAFFGTVSFKQ